MKKTSDSLLLIFTRNPELGKCKTRLAATVGPETALEIYTFLLEHTVSVTKDLHLDKQVYYSEEIWEDDLWDPKYFHKALQEGIDLGERMYKAFEKGFKNGYKKICIIGSDLYDIAEKDILHAFETLDSNSYVIGPAKDGGYYLLGMTSPNISLFQDKAWGTVNVLKHTLENLNNEKYALLATRNDVDLYEDIADIEAFQPFLNSIKNDPKTTG